MSDTIETLYPVPEHIKGAIDRYVNHRTRPGDFTLQILQDNFTGAVLRAAPDITLKDLYAIALHCIWKLPEECWGSEQKVEAWLRSQVEKPDPGA